MRKTPSGGVTLNAKGALLHRQLYVLLKEQIMSGHYQSGDLLPTQEALCRQFSISRITVRRALNDLVEDGLVHNRQGVGAFVAPGAGRAKHGPDFGFIGDLHRALKETTMQVLRLEWQRCPRIRRAGQSATTRGRWAWLTVRRRCMSYARDRMPASR